MLEAVVARGDVRGAAAHPAAQTEGTAPAQGSDRVSIGLNFFVEDREGYHLVGHSGDQNALHRPLLHLPGAATPATWSAFNTQTPPVSKGDREKTRAFDEALRTYVLRNVFPALPR